MAGSTYDAQRSAQDTGSRRFVVIRRKAKQNPTVRPNDISCRDGFRQRDIRREVLDEFRIQSKIRISR